MKLKQFQKGKKLKVLFISVSILLVIISLLIGHTYAIFQKESEVQFINATVRFPKASEVSYTNTSNSSVTNVEEALNDLYGKLGK